MPILNRKLPHHLIPIHLDNAGSKDWIILLEAGTIVGPSPDKLRVARATLERKIVTKYDIFRGASISWSSRITIRAFMRSIAVLNYTDRTKTIN